MTTTAPPQATPLPTAPLDREEELVVQVLQAAARRKAGVHAEARPGQQAMALDSWRAMRDKTRLAAQAPTGTGKSFAYLVAAGLRRALHGERTIVSTEGLMLQGQLVDEDLVDVAAAIEEVRPGTGLRFAMLKGWTNYIDPERTWDLATRLLDRDLPGVARADGWADVLEELEGKRVSELKRIVAEEKHSSTSDLQKMAAWALREFVEGGRGDMAECPVSDMTWADYALLTASKEDAADPKLFAYESKAASARKEAGEADIVVLNHSQLAVQAVAGISYIMGSKDLGKFHNIVVDEAHSLAGKVRDFTQSVLSPRRLTRFIDSVERLEGPFDKQVRDHIDEVIRKVGSEAEAAKLRHSTIGDYGLAHDEPALTVATEASVAKLLQDIRKGLVPSWEEYSAREALADTADALLVATKARKRYGRALASADAILDAVTEFCSPAAGIERWPDFDQKFNDFEFKSACVEVRVPIERRLWTHPGDKVEITEEGADGNEHVVGTERGPSYSMGVVCASATLIAETFCDEVGIPEDSYRSYESSFGDAHRGSLAYVPVYEAAADGERVSNDRGKFDNQAHAEWAAERIVELVQANDGHALVIGASIANANRYAEALKRALGEKRVVVKAPFEKMPSAVARWRARPGSVLVGTKGMTTGLDAPGERLSLVVVDRPPRAPFNALDDARAKALVARRGISRQEADALVYVGDASLVLEQAVGRLIRRASDWGTVAVLDTRLSEQAGRLGPKYHCGYTRELYRKALGAFGALQPYRFSDVAAMLSERAASASVAAERAGLARA